LDGTVREVKSLAFLFTKRKDGKGKAIVMTGSDATEERLKEEVKGKRYIHLATHGFFALEGVRSRFAVGMEEAREQKAEALAEQEQALAGEYPGLLSGVVLAGANLPPEKVREDGILTAAEAAWLELKGCELVVLSACQTGLGTEEGGENLIGLRRSLYLAGVRGTITSLWRISDQVTDELMHEFYSRLWIEGQGKLEALRGAQLAMLRRNRVKYNGNVLPGTWGAFVLDGDWR
jgi:CHAT domain-containing protein